MMAAKAQLPDGPYPCPACVGTMPPGVGSMSMAKMLDKGSGKVYHPYSGAMGTFGQAPEGNWYECHRCGGTGLVGERRRGLRDRRSQNPRGPMPEGAYVD